MRLLAERAGGKTIPQQEAMDENTSDSVSNKPAGTSYLTPWTEAIATSGMPKIPKIRKIEVSAQDRGTWLC